MFIESSTFTTYYPNDPEAHAALMSRIGPSIRTSLRKAPKERKKPEYMPVSPAKKTGKVTYFNLEKGFGRINRIVFFDKSAIVDGNIARFRKGEIVAYEEGVDRKGRVIAVNVQLVAEASE